MSPGPTTGPVFDDEVDRRAREEAAKAERREALRLRVRECFPETMEWADAFRAQFGPEVEVRYAIEAGRYVGKVPEAVLDQHEKQHGVRPQRLTVSKED